MPRRPRPPPHVVPLPPAGTASFPREARLVKPWEFALVQEKGRTLDLGPLVFRWLDRGNLPPNIGPATAAPDGSARLGLAISRRVGGSVQRNRVKRLVRETFRRRRRTLAGLDLVVTGRPAAVTLDHREFGALFDRLAARLGRTRHPDDPVFEAPPVRTPPRPTAPPPPAARPDPAPSDEGEPDASA